MMKRFFAFLSCIFALTVFFAAVSVYAEEPRKITELILDASGSMNGKLKTGESKIDAAKKVVNEVMQKLKEETVIAFRAYGHQSPREKHDCKDTALIFPFGKAGDYREKVSTHMKSISAKGYTPITFVLQKAAEDFPGEHKGQRVIVLVSDGKETCQGDPCAMAKSLVKANAKLVMHTIGFGVDQVTKEQLECIARVTGGKYFAADDALQLAEVLNQAVGTAKKEVIGKKGDGWLEVKGADLTGHTITNAETGAQVGILSHTKATMKLPAGLYNVTVGKAVWKSIEIKAGETTVLNPGILKVENASLRGHTVLERETGIEHGSISSLKGYAVLMPGEYDIMFGKLSWPVTINPGETIVLNPGTVKVEWAHYMGHKIRNSKGEVIAQVSNTMNWTPLPPGNYTIEIGKKKIPFSLKEDEHLTFQSK